MVVVELALVLALVLVSAFWRCRRNRCLPYRAQIVCLRGGVVEVVVVVVVLVPVAAAAASVLLVLVVLVAVALPRDLK